MDIENLSYAELDEEMLRGIFVSEETRSAVVQGQLFADSVLEYICRKKLSHPDIFFTDRTDYSIKLRLARALDLISEREFHAFKALNKLRNKFAHQWNYETKFSDAELMICEFSNFQEKVLRDLKEKGDAREFTVMSTLYLCEKALSLAKPMRT